MGWFIIALTFSMLINLIGIGRKSDQEKDLEILILRYQLAILQRKLDKPLRPTRAEKLTLAVLFSKLKQITSNPANQLGEIMRIFQPETVLRWHRELVRRKWTHTRKRKGGRPRISQEIENLIVRFAQENPRWGCGKIEGELLKLDFKVSCTTIRNVLNRHNIVPAPVRGRSIRWRNLLNHYRGQMLACDFFTVETLCLKTLYVLFFIELGTRRVSLAGVTPHPDGPWVTQQARQHAWELQNHKNGFCFLVHDRDTKFTQSFDTVFRFEGIQIIHTPFRAPNANAHAERWVRSVREECLDHLLILNQTHLRRVLKAYVDYYNLARPHQGLEQQSPIPSKQSMRTGPIQRRPVLGGLINDYFRAPTRSSVRLH